MLNHESYFSIDRMLFFSKRSQNHFKQMYIFIVNAVNKDNILYSICFVVFILALAP